MEPLIFNNLELRLARTAADRAAAQDLRYRIFYDEMGAVPSDYCRMLKRDIDSYDDICDHLIVVDLEKAGTGPQVIGTYRFLRGQVAARHGGFYSEDEFDLRGLKTVPGEIMELGRSCIDAAYRRRGAMQLLWRGIAGYILDHDVEVMFGCGSIHGIDVEEAKRVLSFLHHYHRAPGHIRPRAVLARYVEMNRLTKSTLDRDRARAEMPPLLKGYLRLGGFVGDGAVIDYDFNSIDVCVIVETRNVTGKYMRHFTKDHTAAATVAAAAAERGLVGG